ncbi:amidase family protein, partial [Staphylococcus epidermidis]|uniref:amidase family protein n=1 Tax=Staphylococcus epidermidis TaxID=1282 RepID=UPI001C92DB00
YFNKTLNPFHHTPLPPPSSPPSPPPVPPPLLPFTLPSHTPPSITQPPSYSPLLGIKPTYPRLSRFPLLPFASSLHQI